MTAPLSPETGARDVPAVIVEPAGDDMPAWYQVRIGALMTSKESAERLATRVRAALSSPAAPPAESGTTDEIKRLQGVIERERTAAHHWLEAARKTLGAHRWVTHTRASYEWDDKEFFREATHLFNALDKVLANAKKETHARDLSDCPTTRTEVNAARRELLRPPSDEGTPPQFITDDLVEQACAAFYPNWTTYSSGYRAAKHTRWARALRAVFYKAPEKTDEIRYPRTEFVDGKLTVTGYEVISPEDHAKHTDALAEVEAGFYWTMVNGWMVPSEKLYERDKELAYRFDDLARGSVSARAREDTRAAAESYVVSRNIHGSGSEGDLDAAEMASAIRDEVRDAFLAGAALAASRVGPPENTTEQENA